MGLKYMMILKGKRKDKSLDKIAGVIIQMQDNVWMTEELMLRWLTMMWGGVAATRKRRLLVWDEFRAHKTERGKVCGDQICNTDLVIVPGGCTSMLQAPDILCNKPFKERYTNLWNEWSINADKTYTVGGNKLAPTRETCVQWVEVWASVTSETIIQSFKSADITTAIDGSEDGLMTYLHENPDLAEVRGQLYGGVGTPSREGEDEDEEETPLEVLSGSESDFEGFTADSLL